MNKRVISKIVTGGQTGTDRAALDIGLQLQIPLGGWCPKGRWAEDGAIDCKYPLMETELAAVEQRTELNARDSDGTLILGYGEPVGGTLFTVACADKHNKPWLLFDLLEPVDVSLFESWLRRNRISVLNIAGPRESLKPGVIYSASKDYLGALLNKT